MPNEYILTINISQSTVCVVIFSPGLALFYPVFVRVLYVLILPCLVSPKQYTALLQPVSFHTHTQTHTHTHTHTHTRTDTHTCTNKHTHTCIHTHTRMHTHFCICMGYNAFHLQSMSPSSLL